MWHWRPNDRLAGHVRRYEKTELAQRLSNAGFRLVQFWSYGFPILNLTYPISALFRKEIPSVDLSLEANSQLGESSKANSLPTNFSRSKIPQRAFKPAYRQQTALSGTLRFEWPFQWLFNEIFWYPFLWVQIPFLNSDRGSGYLVNCVSDKGRNKRTGSGRSS